MSSRDGTAGASGTLEAIVFTAALLAFTVVMLAATTELRPSAAIVPRIVGIPLGLLLCYRLIREILQRVRNSSTGAGVQPPDAPGTTTLREAGAIVWLIALPAASTVLGFVAGPALWVFCWSRFRARERVRVAVIAAAIAAAAILGLFQGLLGVRLPNGLADIFL